MSLRKDQILAANDLPVVEVPVPEWGGSIYVKTLTSAEKTKFGLGFESMPKDRVREHFVVLTACDENGALLFAEEDIEALAQKAFEPMHRIYEAASKLNVMSAKDEDEIRKNSRSVPTSGDEASSL